MNSEWKEYKLDEIANIVDCEHKTAPTVDKSEYYSIRTPNIADGRIDFDNSNRISYETYLKWTQRAVPKEGDIILAREAPVGAVGLVKKGYKVCLGQRTVLISVNCKDCNSEYLLYYLVNPDVKQRLISRTTGSVVSHLNVKDIRSFTVHLPSLPEQKRIAEILSSLDDKIELNNKMNKNLEEMAQTIFKQWFVNFEFPDENGNPYKSSGGKMIQSELGEIPVGWSVGRLYDLIELNYGKALKENLRNGNEYPVYGSSGVVGFHNEYLVNAPGIIIGRKGTLGKVLYSYDNFWAIDTTYYIKSKTEKSNYLFEYFMLKSIDFKEFNSDSAVPGLNRNVAHAHNCVIPAKGEILKFNSAFQNIFKKIKSNIDEIESLTRTRDQLLPKLMNGEINLEVEIDKSY
ncbi:MAG: restriction endonuclease subunit S [Candidatus Delongbacteria bacterium]|nr:restriction endonuclease subunit S [Candidatus Delongbacteria bacterium]